MAFRDLSLLGSLFRAMMDVFRIGVCRWRNGRQEPQPTKPGKTTVGLGNQPIQTSRIDERKEGPEQ